MQRLKSLLSTLLLMIITLTLLEGALRLRQWWKYGKAGPQFSEFIEDQKTGLRIPRPGFTNKRIHINSLGFRGPEIQARKPAQRIRVAFLGGSTTYCAEVSGDEMTWPHLVTEQMKKSWPQVEFDYVNAAAPGYTTLEMLKTMKDRVAAYQPDVVVIYEATNDLSSDTRLLAEQRGLRPATGQGEHVSTMAGYSVLWNLMELNYTVYARQQEAKSGRDRLVFDPGELSRSFEARLKAVTLAAKGQNRVVALVTFSPRVRRSQSPEERLRASNTSLFYMPYMSVDGLVAGFEEYNRVIRKTASEMDVLLIGDEDSIPADDEHYNDSVHFKDAGAQRMAARVSKRLVESQQMNDLIATRKHRVSGHRTPSLAGGHSE